ncbi:stalk domain-containing protein [Paenibacillus sp. SI8]|uniref:stalk domain-containing protein n=1 Tax=unclassified Paenibacillus TaxID=185978 RepID=UPI003466A738
MKQFFKSKKAMFLGALLIFTMGNVSGVSASSSLKEITAFLDDSIHIFVNGLPFTAKDSDGKVLTPINYEGNTYLPMRSVAEATGLSVKWEDATRTAKLGPSEKDNEEDLVLIAKDNSFQVTLPSTWTRNDNLISKLNPFYKVGAINYSKKPNQFMSVNSEPRSGYSDEFHVKDYAKLIIEQMNDLGVVKNVKVISEKELTISGLPAKQVEVSGMVNKSISSSYLCTFIESKTTFYQLTFWSATKSIDDPETLTKIAITFKELSN